MYYCITVDKSFCDKSGIPISSGQFAMNIHDEYANTDIMNNETVELEETSKITK